jgi:hypothetical protein
MKRIVFLWLCGLTMAAFWVSLSGAQDSGNLGDYARQVRKQKAQVAPAGKKFDNDNLPKDDKLSVVGQTAPEESTPATNGEAAPSGEAGAATEAGKAATPAETRAPTKSEAKEQQADEQAEKQKMYKDWQQKIHAQQDQIDLLTRELDIANREYRLRAAAFYADAGNRLRNSAAWDKEDAQYKDQIGAKQKSLDDAKQKLEDMQEQARKAGVPSSVRE